MMIAALECWGTNLVAGPAGRAWSGSRGAVIIDRTASSTVPKAVSRTRRRRADNDIDGTSEDKIEKGGEQDNLKVGEHKSKIRPDCSR